jgi:hypothetical protein
MGHIRSIPQTDQNGQQSSQTGIEITYGGKEAPFGGLDTSRKATAYIDPNCLASTDGFIVVDDQLVLISFTLGNLPVLWNGVQAIPLKFGNYYDSVLGYLNYALGYKSQLLGGGGNPLFYAYEFYLTIWDTKNNIVDNQVIDARLFFVNLAPTAATLFVPVVLGESLSFTDTGHIGINYGVSGVFTGSVTFGYTPGMTQAQVVTGFVTAINGVSGSTLFTAAASTDGLGLILTATTPGAAGNNLQIQDDSASNTAALPPAFYTPFSGSLWTSLEGGNNGGASSSPATFSSVSSTAVGGVIYFANLGPFILKYSKSSATPGFFISSTYQGVNVIRKFAGSLIGLGVIPALGVVVQNSRMIFAWSAANNLDEWSPVTAAGLVTGAGFAELADIDDALTSLIVSNNTAFIIRAQGVSYATSLGSGTNPFQFAHISLGDNGEGCQNPDLVAQYGETGAFAGNTQIYAVSGGLQKIGDKIKSLFFSTITDSTLPLGSFIYPAFLGGDKFPFLVFIAGGNLFLYHTENQTWMLMTYTAPVFSTFLLPAVFASQSGVNPSRTEFNGALINYYAGAPYGVNVYNIIEGVNNNGFIISPQPQLTFPQEELLFGRDVTIDSLYIALVGLVTGVVNLQFFFNGILFSSKTLDPTIFNSLNMNPVEMKIFPTASMVFTSHSPQLKIVVNVAFGATAELRFTKIQEYASFDPAQRPV